MIEMVDEYNGKKGKNNNAKKDLFLVINGIVNVYCLQRTFLIHFFHFSFLTIDSHNNHQKKRTWLPHHLWILYLHPPHRLHLLRHKTRRKK